MNAVRSRRVGAARATTVRPNRSPPISSGEIHRILTCPEAETMQPSYRVSSLCRRGDAGRPAGPHQGLFHWHRGGRRDATFDPQLDPVVRIEAGRLRPELEHYCPLLATGRDDALSASTSKGAYIPASSMRPGRPAQRLKPTVPLAAPISPSRPGDGDRQHWRWAVTGAVIACLFALVWLGTRLERAENAAAVAAAAQPSILVLPFADIGSKDISASRRGDLGRGSWPI